jgi:hypothetical protein
MIKFISSVLKLKEWEYINRKAAKAFAAGKTP